MNFTGWDASATTFFQSGKSDISLIFLSCYIDWNYSWEQVTVCEAINIAEGYVVLKMNSEFIALQRESSSGSVLGSEAVMKLVLLLG